MRNIDNNDLANKVKSNFFKIWITKEILHSENFERFYINFLDNYWKFNYESYKIFLDEIFWLISNNDLTSIRPNNSNLLDERSIENIISGFWDNYYINYKFLNDLIWIIESWFVDLYTDTNIHILKIKEVKTWLKNVIKQLYNNWIYSLEVSETIDEIIEKTIKVLKEQ